MPYGFIGAVAAALLLWLGSSRHGRARVEHGSAIVEYGGAWRGVTIVFFLFPVAIAVLAMVSPPKPEERWFPLQIICGFLAIIVPLALEVFRRRLRIDQDALVSESPWTGSVRIPWDEVTAVSYQPAMCWYVIDSRGQGRMRVGMFMSGLETLAAALAERAARAPEIEAGVVRMRSGRELG